MLAGVEEVDDLNGSGEMIVGEVPDPLCAIADDDFLFSAGPAAFPGFDIEPFAKLLGVLNGPSVGGRRWVANGEPLLIPAGLGEHTAEFDLPGMCG